MLVLMTHQNISLLSPYLYSFSNEISLSVSIASEQLHRYMVCLKVTREMVSVDWREKLERVSRLGGAEKRVGEEKSEIMKVHSTWSPN